MYSIWGYSIRESPQREHKTNRTTVDIHCKCAHYFQLKSMYRSNHGKRQMASDVSSTNRSLKKVLYLMYIISMMIFHNGILVTVSWTCEHEIYRIKVSGTCSQSGPSSREKRL